MFDWDASRDHFVGHARRAVPGLPKEHLVPGALVTVSPCKCTGDRSYSHDVWEIVAANEGHLSIRKIGAKSSDYFGYAPCIDSVHEHEFYGADHMVRPDNVVALSSHLDKTP